MTRKELEFVMDTIAACQTSLWRKNAYESEKQEDELEQAWTILYVLRRELIRTRKEGAG